MVQVMVGDAPALVVLLKFTVTGVHPCVLSTVYVTAGKLNKVTVTLSLADGVPHPSVKVTVYVVVADGDALVEDPLADDKPATGVQV